MKDLKKSQELINLYEIYGDLLTAKQQEYFELYFYDDYSLSEIANQKEISRTAVYDALSTITQSLNNWEQQLLVYNKQQQREKLYQQYQDKPGMKDLIANLQKIDNE